MQRYGTELLLAATDVANYLACRHRTALDLAVAHGRRERPYRHDPLREVLAQRGLEHERAHVEGLRTDGTRVIDLSGRDDGRDRVGATRDAMQDGFDFIVQGELRDGRWTGRPDVMRRVDAPSALGRWSYEIEDTKLARETRAGTVLQLSFYSELLRITQGATPERFHVVTPYDTASYRVDDYAAYFRFVRHRMLGAVTLGPELAVAASYPEPVDHCDVCHWFGECASARRRDDHLSLVAGITRMQRGELTARNVSTVVSLAGLPLPLEFRPKRGSAESYERVREQARLQVRSRGEPVPAYELLPVQPELGLARLPAPSPGDLFLDLEGDPFAGDREGGREYLFGLTDATGGHRARWALTDADERAAFEWLIDTIVETARTNAGMHVYHYAPYEPAALKRLMGRYATRERELDEILRAGRMVDLYAVVRQGMRVGVERYSIKQLEPLYAFARAVPLGDANVALRAMEHALELGDADGIPAEVRDAVEGYNRDDCVSTLRLRDWLETLRPADLARPEARSGDAPDAVDEKAQRVEALRARLLPQGHDLLAYLLDYHRREDKSTWWEYFRLCELGDEDLADEREAVAGLTHVERLAVEKTGAVIDRYAYPSQETEIDRGDDLRTRDGTFGKVEALDRAAGTIDVRKTKKYADAHPTAAFAFMHISSDAMEQALLRLGDTVADGTGGWRAARALLAGDAPRLNGESLGARDGETAADVAVRVVHALDGTVLSIQGPPGAGKTHCGARMILDLVRRGRRVGITATSHKVIRHLLEGVAKADAAVTLGHVGGDLTDDPRIAKLDNRTVVGALHDRTAQVVGGTQWLWSRPELASAVDVLFVDEAGQMALANVLAASQAADSLVLLGDPQQLQQPSRGSHPDGVGVSALGHLLGGALTIPADRGLFLAETWRLAPALCAFTSEQFYAGRLASRAGLDAQRIRVDGMPDAGLGFVAVEHEGNRGHAHEELDVVESIVGRLTADGARWTDRDGNERPLRGEDVLVVSPYNAQVTRLAERLAPNGARVGTVDKFQGQEAPVVIYSMASSTPEDAPRGMDFLYSLNRLNVATSRARCVAIVVASPRLLEPECRTPRQMRLANALCRLRELATEIRA